jgi:hypothetical protein
MQEAGSRKQEAGSRKQEAGSRKQEAGSRKQEAGSRKQEELLLLALRHELPVSYCFMLEKERDHNSNEF